MQGFNNKSPFVQWVSLVAQFTAAFAAVYLGILALGWDLMGLGLLLHNASSFVRPILYIVGLFGVISLLLLVLHMVDQKNGEKN